MSTLKQVHDRFGDYICRRCINEYCNADLKREDCKYSYFAVCRCCGEEHWIVTNLTLAGKAKLLLK